jgi:hypothetical protein
MLKVCSNANFVNNDQLLTNSLKESCATKKNNKLIKFLNELHVNNYESQSDLNNDKKKWWEYKYPLYTSLYTCSDLYHTKNDDMYIDGIDTYTGLIIQTFIENKLNLDKESIKIHEHTQKYDDKLVFINPTKNLYYFDMLFRQLIDFDLQYSHKNEKAYNMINNNFKKKFYYFCFKNSYKNNNVNII